jgi:hypothetical protein
MKKENIDIYQERYLDAKPSINVKVGYRKFAPGITPETLDCDEGTFEKAMEFAFETAQERFWDEAQAIADKHLSRAGYMAVKVHAAGRSGGHLVVAGMPTVDTWDALTVSAWGRFVQEIEDNIEYHCTSDMILEDIFSNRWNEPGAEKYNFTDGDDGLPVCLSELKQKAIAAGFRAVVRR